MIIVQHQKIFYCLHQLSSVSLRKSFWNLFLDDSFSSSSLLRWNDFIRFQITSFANSTRLLFSIFESRFAIYFILFTLLILWESICHFFYFFLFSSLHCLLHFVQVRLRFTFLLLFLVWLQKSFLIFWFDISFFQSHSIWKIFCIHVKLISSSINFSFLSSAVIVTVFEFQRFLQTNHKSIKKLNENTRQLVAVIIAFSRSLSLIAFSIKNANAERAISSESVKYSVVWITDVLNLRRVV